MVESEIRQLLAAARVGRLATADATGRPHVVPLCFALEGDAIWWAVDAKPKSGRTLKRLGNIAENPRVSLLVDAYDEDWRRLWWARADGAATIVEPGPDERRGRELLAAKYAQYAAQPPPGLVVRIDVDTWRGWRASTDEPAAA
jgi:PPOX class probable F420-dependent enzyme